jgi:hypothetical protein
MWFLLGAGLGNLPAGKATRAICLWRFCHLQSEKRGRKKTTALRTSACISNENPLPDPMENLLLR